MASLFTKIIQRELPAYIVHEDERTISFLALDQVNLGHCLVVPKKEVDHWLDVDPADLQSVYLNAQIVGRAIQQVSSAPRIGQMVAGFEVNHFHLHLIPAWKIADLDFKRARRFADTEMKQTQDKIQAILGAASKIK